jgi:hypothetical protein
MGIERIKLGPKSKYAEPPKEDWAEAVIEAAEQTVAKRFGCSCGRYVLLTRDEVYESGGVAHRTKNPCHEVNGSKQVGRSVTIPGSLADLELRMKAVEKVMAKLLVKLNTGSPASWDEV